MRKLLNWVYLKLHGIMLYISIALFNTEQEILKADPNALGEKNKHVQRMRHRNQLLEKFYAGQTDEKYVKDYYEVLHKADEFIKNSTPFKMAVGADRHGMNYAKADKYGRTYEHFGFFDAKSKNSGKTIKEVVEEEMMNRRTTDDDYELIQILNNKPIDKGLLSLGKDIDESKLLSIDEFVRESKNYEFPMKVYRTNNEVINKIEQLTEFLHVKKIGFDFVLIEFFIPLKFKTTTISEDSDIFKELINIDQIFFKDKFGKMIAFKINEYVKRIVVNETHEVLKFNGYVMEVK